MPREIEIIARGIWHSRGRVLLCRNLKKGYYYLPGGHVEFGESARKSLEREFVEETGLKVKAGAIIAVTEGSFVAKGKTHHEVNLVFHVEHSGTRVRSREPRIGFEWVPIGTLDEIDLRPASAIRLLKDLPKRTDFLSDMRL